MKNKVTFNFCRDQTLTETPIEPAKLFRVERIKPVRGNPFWERRILRDLGIIEVPKLFGRLMCLNLLTRSFFQRGKYVAIVKNIPENNARLWKIKHLIHITPIRFPFGEPTLEDVNHTLLKENGECIVTKKIAVDEVRIQATETFQNDPTRLDRETVKKDLRQKWLTAWDWKP